MKTNQLTGAALDWAVAEANGTPIYRSGKTLTRMDMDGQHYWQPTFDWSQGGPIIERESISILCTDDYEWFAGYGTTQWDRGCPTSPTPLIAAMRCYVASKLGDEVTLPPELEQKARCY